MIKVCGYSRDAYTLKPPFLDGGESQERQTILTTGSSVWESSMMEAKSETGVRKTLFSFTESMYFCLHFFQYIFPSFD